jgi:hypothetical protein
MRGAHVDLMGEMGQLCVQVRELVIELRHTQRTMEINNSRMDKVEEDIRSLQLESALNKPILDIARSINTKMWLTICSGAIAVSASTVNWSAFAGH